MRRIFLLSLHRCGAAVLVLVAGLSSARLAFGQPPPTSGTAETGPQSGAATSSALPELAPGLIALPKIPEIPPADPRPAVLPALAFSGDTSGEGTLSVGVDGRVPLANDGQELRVKVSIAAASKNGVATIVSSTAEKLDGPTSWAAALDFVYSVLHIAPANASKSDNPDFLDESERRDVILTCFNQDLDPITSANRREIKLPKAPTIDARNFYEEIVDLDPSRLCIAARRKFIEAQLEKTLPLPKHQLSLSLRFGTTAMKQLSATDEPGVFSETTKRRPRLAAGVAYAGSRPRSHLTFESLASIASSYEEQEKVQWCTPAGEVALPDNKGKVPAQSCKDLPLGDPKHKTSIHAAGYVGIVDSEFRWRASIGPAASYDIVSGKNPYDIGIEMPLYLVRSSAAFSGIVRITPAVFVTRSNDGKTDTKALLTLTLLADRTLFATSALQ